jgi:hypothetical protein
MTSLGKVELVIKHDDIVRLGREFEGMKESRFLNCCRMLFQLDTISNTYPKEYSGLELSYRSFHSRIHFIIF